MTRTAHDDDADLIGLLAKRRSPRKLQAEASTTNIDDALDTASDGVTRRPGCPGATAVA